MATLKRAPADSVRFFTVPVEEHADNLHTWIAAREEEFKSVRAQSLRRCDTFAQRHDEFWRLAKRRGMVRTFPGFASRINNTGKEKWEVDHERVLRLVDFVDRSRRDIAHCPDVAFAGNTAAHLLGLPTISRHPNYAIRQAPPSRSHFSSEFSKTTRASFQPRIMELAGLPVSTPAQTIVDLARWRGPLEGLVAADFALHQRIVTTDEILEILDALPRVRGIQHARTVAELMDSRTQSPGESLTKWRLTELGIGGLEPQMGVTIGERTYYLDLFDQDTQLGFEFDGLEKLYNPAMTGGQAFDLNMAHEAERERLLRLAGVGVFRLSWNDVITQKGFRAWLAERRRLGFPY